MAWEMRKCAVCDECGHVWLAKEFPKRCAKCKSSKWNSGTKVPETVGVAQMAEQTLQGHSSESLSECKPQEREVAGSSPVAHGIKRMSDEDFFALSNSDKLRARREGRY